MQEMRRNRRGGTGGWLGSPAALLVHALVLAQGSALVGIANAQEAEKAEPVKDSGANPSAQPVTDDKTAPPAPAASRTAATNEKPGSEYFVNAAAALKKAQAITYRVKYHATGQMEQYSANVEAQVRMLRDPSASGQTNGWMVRSTGSGIPKPGGERMEFDAAWMGSPIEFVSHADKKVIERRSSREAKSPAYAIANSARMQEMFAARPFSRELAPAADFNVLDQQTIGGVKCDVVEVTFGERKGKSVWAFGAEDHLPRRFESVIDNQMMSGSTITEIEGLEFEDSRPPKLSKTSLRVDVPEGYTEDRPAKPTPPKPVVPATPEDKKADDGTTTLKSAEPVPMDLKVPEAVPTVTKDAPVPESRMVPEVPAPSETPAPKEAPATPPALVDGPDFELRSSAGGKVSMSSFKGQMVVMEFGASWCLACRDSRPELDQLAQQNASRPVKFVALSVRDKSPDAAIDRFKDGNHPYPLLVEADATATAYQVRTFPTYYVLGFNHEVVKVEAGFTKTQTMANISAAIEQYLASHPSPSTDKPAGQ
jgi:thiol-disulfide isomerase/thioredoxin